MSAAASGTVYLVPLRWDCGGPLEDLAGYLGRIAAEVDEVLVVDGSALGAFDRHGQAFGTAIRHLRPDPGLGAGVGKVGGVITGIRTCAGERVVIADDDVRYDRETLRRALELLGEADLVRPQNHFDDLPWHAAWDTARTLLNRVFTADPALPVGDFPGTLAVRRSSFLAARAYDGRALFENLELIRTVRAAGGTVLTPLDLYVPRRPPSTGHFVSQRVRQAYDDQAMPARLAIGLGLGTTGIALARRRPAALPAAALAVVAVAEVGRRRAGGRARFPAAASLLAPAWAAERAVCSWLALAARLRGGVRYAGGRMRLAANSERRLRRRYRAAVSPEELSRPLSERNPTAL